MSCYKRLDTLHSGTWRHRDGNAQPIGRHCWLARVHLFIRIVLCVLFLKKQKHDIVSQRRIYEGGIRIS